MISLALFSGVFWFSSKDAPTSSKQSDDFIVTLRLMTEEEMIQEPEKASTFRFGIRKMAHFSIYLWLGIFIFLTLKEFTDALGFAFLMGWVITLILAGVDEYHQSFVPGRSMEIRDILIDGAGAFLGIVILYLLFKAKDKKRSYQNVYYFSQ